MTTKIFMPFLFITVLICTVFAARKVDSTLIKLNNGIAVLKGLRAEKLERLEALETERWNKRYRHNEEMKLLESQSRQHESRYSTLAGQLNRKQEDILLLKNALDEEKVKFEEARNQHDAFVLQVRQAVEETASKIELDFPIDIAERTAAVSSISESLKRKNVQITGPLTSFIDLKLERIARSRQQVLSTRAVLFGDRQERTAWNLRFGTVLMIDIDKDSSAYQLLMHTGALQGQRYMWKNSVGESFHEEAMQLLTAVQQNSFAPVPLDILQNGKIGTAEELTGSRDLVARFKLWYSQGGLIMYPLFFCAILALLLSIERLLTLTARHHRYRKSYKNIIPLINKHDWRSATAYCSKRGTGLTRAIQEILHRRDGSREQAEQHVKQILLAEVPALEKRMSFISALGASAPLLGLLGTVSGMITLFKVITETGTNDARILAGGISEALVTTQTGLFIAIPILLIHGYLSERLDDILSHYNETVLEVFNIVFNGDKKETGGNDS